jgi:hypothetical protein
VRDNRTYLSCFLFFVKVLEVAFGFLVFTFDKWKEWSDEF